MKQETATRLILGGLCILILGVSFASWQLAGMGTAIQQVINHTEARAMITELVDNNDGIHSATITTSTGDMGDPNESWDDVLARHAERVAAYKILVY